MPHFHRPTSILVLGLASLTVYAQQYPYKAYRQAEGLLNISVETLTQDGEGYIWAATENGVFRYDGSRFVRREGVSGWVTNLTTDHRKRAVVVRQKEICRDNGERFECFGLPETKVRAQQLFVTQPVAVNLENGRIYVALGDLHEVEPIEGLKPPEKVHSKILVSKEQAGGDIASVYRTTAGALWFGCGRDLCRLYEGRLTKFSSGAGLGPGPWAAITGDTRTGAIYARSADQVVMLKPGASNFEVLKSGDDLSTLRHPRLYVDRTSHLYAPSATGVLIWSGKSWRVVGRANGWHALDARSVLEDHEGSLWIASAGTGVLRWIGRQEWSNYGTGEGLENPSVWAVLRDGDRLWVGCEQGLYIGTRRTPGGSDWRFRSVSGLNKTRVRALVHTQRTMLAGTGDGIFQFAAAPDGSDPAPPKRIWPLQAGAPDKRVRTLLADSRGRLWIGTLTGLYLWKAGEPEPVVFPLPRNLKTPVSRIVEANGMILASTHEGVLQIGRDLQAVMYDDTPNSYGGSPLNWPAVGAMAVTAKGEIWVGGLEAGLGRGRFGGTSGDTLRFESIVLRPETVGQGGNEPDSVIYDIASASGSVWLSTDRGINRFDGERWTHFDESDGLVWNDTSSNALFAEPDGSLWIGTSNGLSHYRPRPKANGVAPASRAVLHSIVFGGARVDSRRKQTVPYDRNSLSAGFSLLSYANETNREYEYRIAGLSKDWTRTQQDSVEFPELPTGSYSLEVRARSGGGPWSQPEAFSFEVAKPWWELWPVRLAGFVALAGFIWFVQRGRQRHEREQLFRLERAVAERTSALAAEKTRAEEATRARSEFLANMSHEIRTPMNAVLGLTSLLLDMETSSEARDFLNTIRSSSASLLTLLNDILDFSKIESGKLEFENQPFALRQCVEEAAEMFSARAAEKGLELAVDVDPALPDRMVGDVTRLRQILVNLISNAVKFTERGEIVVSARKLELELGEQRVRAAQLLFSVRDTGQGIPHASMGRLFQSFSQIDASTTRRFGGTGLGLAICKRLTQLMGGAIWAESVENVGSDFSFALPLRFVDEEDEDPENALEKRKVPVLAGKRVLVVDDHPATVQSLVRQLECWGMQVSTASSPDEAIQRASQQPFAAVLMDYHLRGMSGMDLSRSLRLEIPDLHTVLLTAGASSIRDLIALQHQTHDFGAPELTGFLTKPVKAEQLRSILLRFLSPQQNGGGKPAPNELNREEVEHDLASRIPLRILVVEDNLINQKVALGLLSRMGYKATVAENGAVALDHLKAADFDVLLLDVQMPVMDGYETAREIHRFWPAATRPQIVGLSANAMHGDRELAIQAGMNDYLTKPLAVQSLQAALCRAAERLKSRPLTEIRY